MKVRVTEIESARSYKDGQRRITIQLDGLNTLYKNELLVPESMLGLGLVELDEEFTVILSREPRILVNDLRNLAGTDRPTAAEVAEKLSFDNLAPTDVNRRVPWKS